MRWVTRRHIRVNRTATAWFVRRFVNADASFEFLDPVEVAGACAQGAVGFNAPGAQYPHRDGRGRCSFEALVDEHRGDDPALRRLAFIVHCADFPEEVSRCPEALGLRAISSGFPRVSADDHETVARAGYLYDALYAALSAAEA